MDIETAKKLIFEYGFVVLLNCPIGIEVGIDNTSWKVGSLFKGFKLVPPGAHILHFSLPEEKHMFKLKRFIHLAHREVYVLAWNSEIGDFEPVEETEGLEDHIAATKNMEYDHCLGAYPIEKETLWKELTNYVSKKMVDKIQPKSQGKLPGDLVPPGKVITTQELEIIEGEANKNEKSKGKELGKSLRNQTEEKNKGSKGQHCTKPLPFEEESFSGTKMPESVIEEEPKTASPKRQTLLEDFQDIPGVFNWTDIPRVHNRGYLSQNPNEITEHNFDKTKLLHETIETKYCRDWKNILGELQMSFIAFIFGEDYEALEQWKKLCEILMRAEEMMIIYEGQASVISEENAMEGTRKERRHAEVMLQLIPVLYNQLKQLPPDFFYDIITKESFLNKLLKEFFEVAFGLQEKSKIKARAHKLSEFIEKKFGVKYTGNQWVGKTQSDLAEYREILLQEGEDGPVIVEDFEFISF